MTVMSDWATIENEVVSVLEGLTVGQEKLLATVMAQTARDRKVLLEAIQGERLPAAYVMITGRVPGDRDAVLAGRVQLSVLIATRSLRADAEARVDGPGVLGMWTVVRQVAGGLQDRMVADTWLMGLVDERPTGGQAGTIVWEQRYEASRPAATTPPTFDSVAVAGTSSKIRVEVGELKRASELFAFPGVDGVFERFGGVRDRPIWWRGQLRAASDAALNTLEAGIEAEIRAGRAATMVDAWGRAFEECVVRAYRRRGPRARDELSGAVLQEAEIELAQLAG